MAGRQGIRCGYPRYRFSRNDRHGAVKDPAESATHAYPDLVHVYALPHRFHELNRLNMWAYSIVTYGDLVIKRNTRQALLHRRPLELTYREYKLLRLLLDQKEQVFTFEQFYEIV